MRESGTGSHPGYHGAAFEQIHPCTDHKGGGVDSARSLFHADLLSRSNVWYAGILALLADLISMGLPEPPARVCVLSSAREPSG